VTSLTIDQSGKLLFAGCWDKTIWSWDITTCTQKQRYVGHSDFVNCVSTCYIPLPASLRPKLPEGDAGLTNTESDRCLILFSGSVDATMNVWRVSSSQRLHTLKGHTRGILDIAIDPLSSIGQEDSAYVLSASSTPEIRSWQVSYESATETTSTLAGNTEAANNSTPKVKTIADTAPVTVHDTSVNKLLFSPSSSSQDPFEHDLYTASSDNTAKLLTRPVAASEAVAMTRPPKWESADTFTHPDWVRCIALDSATSLLVTGCRDEDVRVWDTSSGECIRTLTGHFDSVEGVCIVNGACGGPGMQDKPEDKVANVIEKWIVSISLDGTLRRWSLDGSVEEKQSDEVDESHDDGTLNSSQTNRDVESGGKKQVMTATEEEDRELAELMADMEDD